MASLLYDSDCFFCMVIADAIVTWDTAGHLHPVAIQSEEGQQLLGPVPPERRLDSFHFIDDQVLSGGAALPSLFRHLPGGGVPAAVFERLPGPTDRGYEWISAHRSQISRLVPSRLKARAARRLSAAAHDERGHTVGEPRV